MIVKIITLFLIAMAGLAMVGAFRVRRRKPPKLAGKCPKCGRPRVGPGPCPCGTPLGKG